jgi:hypothetical protein
MSFPVSSRKQNIHALFIANLSFLKFFYIFFSCPIWNIFFSNFFFVSFLSFFFHWDKLPLFPFFFFLFFAPRPKEKKNPNRKQKKFKTTKVRVQHLPISNFDDV